MLGSRAAEGEGRREYLQVEGAKRASHTAMIDRVCLGGVAPRGLSAC